MILGWPGSVLLNCWKVIGHVLPCQFLSTFINMDFLSTEPEVFSCSHRWVNILYGPSRSSWLHFNICIPKLEILFLVDNAVLTTLTYDMFLLLHCFCNLFRVLLNQNSYFYNSTILPLWPLRHNVDLQFLNLNKVKTIVTTDRGIVPIIS
jgi:hypothetical protein